MKFTIYKITNLVDGKIYIGKHRTDNLNDGYMGSGKLISRAVKKHGVNKFKKDILFVYKTEQEMDNKEAELVTEEFCKRSDTYNLCEGGKGGFGYIMSHPNRKKWLKRQQRLATEAFQVKMQIDPVFREAFREIAGRNAKIAYAAFREKYPEGVWLGKTHSSETIKKMQKAHVGKHEGKKNSQFGSMWITDGIFNKKIPKLEPIPEGWRQGRIC